MPNESVVTKSTVPLGETDSKGMVELYRMMGRKVLHLDYVGAFTEYLFDKTLQTACLEWVYFIMYK